MKHRGAFCVSYRVVQRVFVVTVGAVKMPAGKEPFEVMLILAGRRVR